MTTLGTEIDPALRLEDAAKEGQGAPSKRLLMIVNPYATTVSDRLRNLVVYALRGSYIVDAVDTERRDHATELCREAAGEGYDAIVAFGGDGTVNEAANGLVGTGTPLTCLPGGRANVYCRMLGIPADVVDATEHLLALADAWNPRPVDLGRVGSRHFLFSAGVGLDASVVEVVDAHPRLKARLGHYYYAWVATSIYSRRYLLRPPRMEVTFGGSAGSVTADGGDEDGGDGGAGDRRAANDGAANGGAANGGAANDGAANDGAANGGGRAEPLRGVTVLVQNGTPYTYFGNRGVEMAEGAELDSGDLAGLVLRRTSVLDIPSIAWRALSPRARVTGHRQIDAFAGQHQLVVRSRDGRELPLQVDGDYLGRADEFSFAVAPRALTVLA